MANESYSELKAMKLKMLLKRKRFRLIRLFQRVKKFINLWNKIKSKTIYRLEFDSKELIKMSITVFLVKLVLFCKSVIMSGN